MNKKYIFAITIPVVMILFITSMGIFLVNNIDEPEADIGFIEVTIDGNIAHVNAELDLEPDIDMEVSGMKMNIGGDDIDVDYRDDSISAELEENTFRELMRMDTANITGDVKVPIIGPFKMKRTIEEEMDISFIHEIADSLIVSNVSVNFSIFSQTIIEFSLDANTTRDFSLRINNTPASIISPGGTFSSTIQLLEYRTGEGGRARVSMPVISVLGLALYQRDVRIEAWGIEVEVEIPLFNG